MVDVYGGIFARSSSFDPEAPPRKKRELRVVDPSVDHVTTPDGTMRPGPCAINRTNVFEVYSFHTGGANAVFADGTVHFLKATIDIHILAGLITRAGGEVLGSDF